MNTATATRRFGIKETNCTDHAGGTMFWNFTAWRADHPERLMDATEAQRELDRLKASLPHSADRLAVFDVIAQRAYLARFGELRRAVLEAIGYDALPKGEAKAAAGRAAVLVAKAALEAEELAAA
jgi:hypothetical protein